MAATNHPALALRSSLRTLSIFHQRTVQESSAIEFDGKQTHDLMCTALLGYHGGQLSSPINETNNHGFSNLNQSSGSQAFSPWVLRPNNQHLVKADRDHRAMPRTDQRVESSPWSHGNSRRNATGISFTYPNPNRQIVIERGPDQLLIGTRDPLPWHSRGVCDKATVFMSR